MIRTIRLIPPISIHALHEESDRIINTSLEDVLTFQSTLSMRRATNGAGASV